MVVVTTLSQFGLEQSSVFADGGGPSSHAERVDYARMWTDSSWIQMNPLALKRTSTEEVERHAILALP